MLTTDLVERHLGTRFTVVLALTLPVLRIWTSLGVRASWLGKSGFLDLVLSLSGCLSRCYVLRGCGQQSE